MIVGIGTDLIEIARIEKACRKQAFLSRIYTEEECRLAGGSISRLAGNFAVKEAVSKALGTGFRNELGKPYVNLYGGAAKRAFELNVGIIHVTITNTKEYAQAFAVAEEQ